MYRRMCKAESRKWLNPSNERDLEHTRTHRTTANEVKVPK